PSVVALVHYATTTEIYPLSLHDALPISARLFSGARSSNLRGLCVTTGFADSPQYTSAQASSAQAPLSTAGTCHPPNLASSPDRRSEEHTSELQSRENLVCRLLLEKKKED